MQSDDEAVGPKMTHLGEEIIPAILPRSFSDLSEKVGSVVGLVPFVQVDVTDGKFTPNKTWPYLDGPDKDFAAILKEEKGFPSWEDIDFEVDMMVAEPEKLWRDWVLAGAKRLIFHIESVTDAAKLMDAIKSETVSEESFLHTEIGFALNIDTPNEKVEPFLEDLDFVQFMGIARIGYQGEHFDERVLPKITDLRETHPDVTISVDGGVNMESAPRLIEAGADRLVVGSAIFESEDVRGTVMKFRQIFESL